ncbi:MAG: methyltransferase domain-containing protein [Deltaproteobacteria bacterium]|jgi:SAM-dependent methyltransferase|nr:methyltransferase domain-containing protein [Deltaproteobacteria bacterium]
MAFNPNQLLNNPANLLALRGAKPPDHGAPDPDGGHKPFGKAETPEPEPFDRGLYLDAYSRLGLLRIANVADLGCGQGNFTSVMSAKRQKNEVYIGVDSSHARIQIARKAYPGWRFVYGDFTDPKVREEYERFEAYLLLDVLDAMEDDLGFLERITPGKHLVFNVRKNMREGAVRCFEDHFAVRTRYSALLSIKSMGSFRGGSDGGCGMVVASRW